MDSSSLYGSGVLKQFGDCTISISDGLSVLFDRTPTNHPHIHQGFYELCYVLEGSGEYSHGLERFSLQKNDLFVADPDTVHEISSWKTGDLKLLFYWISIESPVDISRQNATDPGELILQSFLKNHKIHSHVPFLRNYLILLSNGIDQKRDFGSANGVLGFVIEALQNLSDTEEFTPREEKGSLQFQRAMQYLDSHIHSPITVEEVADVCCVSLRTLHRMFLRYAGINPKEMINRRKMNLAGKLLLSGWRSKEVALSLSIDDPGQFSRTFKKYIGESPRDFTKRHFKKIETRDTFFL